MAKKQSKKQFDWRDYSRPPRLLTEAQEAAFMAGLLAPLRELAQATPATSFQIRARAAALYHRGVSLVRISGESPFAAELDPLDGPGSPERTVLASQGDVDGLLSTLAARQDTIDAAWDEGDRGKRDIVQAVADSLRGNDLYADELVAVDLEYAYGKRRYDLVALRRLEGVTGPGGFAHPRLVFVDVRVKGQALGGPGGLEAVGADFAEFVKALGGAHLERAESEVVELAEQKVRLGLLPADLEIRSLSEGLPELLVLFAGFDVAAAEHDTALVALHERLAARHFPTERLRFAHIAHVPATSDPGAALREDDLMSYRQFKDYRLRMRDARA